MGWSEYIATEYYNNGTINRKAECDKMFTFVTHNEDGNEVTQCSVLKSTMVGSTYYAALKYKEPDRPPQIIGMVVLTYTKEGTSFGYKSLQETCGPHYYACPDSILDLLSPTDNVWAMEWRERCRQHNKEKRTQEKHARQLRSLPVGSVITFLASAGMKIPEGEPVSLTKQNCGRKNPKWIGGKYFWRAIAIPANYEVIRIGWADAT